jgi:hypothetical protein
MDYDRDGDFDLVVACPDKPYNGTYFFENPGEGQGLRVKGQGEQREQDPSSLNSHPSSLPTFKPAVRVADGPTNVQVSYVNGEPVVMTPGKIYVDFREHQYAHPIKLPLPEKIDPQYQRIRANQWKLVDWEGDGDLDVVVGIGVWDDYGWDDAWDEKGNWKNGPLHGFVYLVENVVEGRGSRVEGEGKKLADDLVWPELLGPRPVFAEPVKVTTSDGKPVDVYGMPSPNFADFDGDGDLDLICGEFLDGFTWFENTGSRDKPDYHPGERLKSGDGKDEFLVRMDLQMITPTSLDWNGDGRIDLICGDEDGRVALIENFDPTNEPMPEFLWPEYFSQEAADVKFGALVTPVSADWDGDGDEDLICGNTAGYIGFFENLGGDKPQWLRPLSAIEDPSLSVIRHQASERGSIQGPCEAKWGYTTLTAGNWFNDGRIAVVFNGIWGQPRATRLLGFSEGGFADSPTASYFSPGGAILEKPVGLRIERVGKAPKPEWTWWTPEPGELVTQWRTTPCVLDWNADGLSDLIMLDHEGYLAFYERSRVKSQESREDKDSALDSQPSALDPLVLLPPQRVFKIDGPCEFDQKHKPVGDKHDDLLRLNANRAGASGRRKLCFADWDGDGRLDLLVNSVNVNWLRNVRTDDEGFTWFHDEGPLDDRVLAGHDTSPTVVDWDRNGIPDLLVGAEDGHLYYKRNPRAGEKP